MKAVEKRLSTGTMFGMPHDMEWELAEEICTRFPGRDVPLRQQRHRSDHARHPPGARRNRTRQDHEVRRRIPRPARRRPGQREAACPEFGDINNPTAVPGGLGVPKTASPT
jgi:glutamate-1-semialdehyde 2,1-aminomutase